MSGDTDANQVAIASYSRAIASALEQRGIEASTVFERAGVPMSHTVDPLLRMSNAQISALFRESVEVTQDPYFGLFVAETFHISQFHVLGFALLSSSTLRDFCLRLQNYYHMASRNADISLLESDEGTILAGRTIHPDICSETVDAFAGVMVRLMRTIAEKDFTPTSVQLRRPKPPQGDKPYRDYFCCEVLFDMPEVRIGIDSKDIDRPLPGASRELAQMHDRTAMEYLEKLGRASIANRARSLIIDCLATGLVSKQQVADGLCLSSRSLELKLASEGTNFQQTLDDTRRSLASGYIEQSGIAITEIAYLLGFSDAANFTRAFKRWTGKSPTDFRKSIGLDR